MKLNWQREPPFADGWGARFPGGVVRVGRGEGGAYWHHLRTPDFAALGRARYTTARAAKRGAERALDRLRVALRNAHQGDIYGGRT